MAFVAVDLDGREFIYEYTPYRTAIEWISDDLISGYVKLPKGSIKKLIGRELTWDDDCVELKED